MRTSALGPQMELAVRHDPCEGCAEMGGGQDANRVSGTVGGIPCGPSLAIAISG